MCNQKFIILQDFFKKYERTDILLYIIHNIHGVVENMTLNMHLSSSHLWMAECQKIDAFELWRKLLRVLWMAGDKISQSFKLNIQKTKIIALGPLTSWKTDEEKVETVTSFIFLGYKITVDSDCSHEIKFSCSFEEKQ